MANTARASTKRSFMIAAEVLNCRGDLAERAENKLQLVFYIVDTQKSYDLIAHARILAARILYNDMT